MTRTNGVLQKVISNDLTTKDKCFFNRIFRLFCTKNVPHHRAYFQNTLHLDVNLRVGERLLKWQLPTNPDLQEVCSGGSRISQRRGRQPIIWPIFAKNCMKMKKFWARGGACPSRPPLDPPLVCVNISAFFSIQKKIQLKDDQM